MIAKKFFFVCAGLLCLGICYHVGARSARAQVGSSQQVAFLSGEVPDGGTIPLPTYPDGTPANESECHWIVSPKVVTVGEGNSVPIFARCSTQGRQVRVYWCRNGCSTDNVYLDCASPAPGCPGAMGGTANYLIIATRNDMPTAAQKTSWGRVKAQYR